MIILKILFTNEAYLPIHVHKMNSQIDFFKVMVMFNFHLKIYKLQDTSLGSSCKELNTSVAASVTSWRDEVS